MGPTASGKTDLALRLAVDYPFEIVSVDSAMVYRGMDIGTAKPDPATREDIPHHLIDIRDPADSYSAALFREDAIECIRGILARGRIPLLTGGTMLYFKALKEGFAHLPAANAGVRANIQALADEAGWPAVHARLAEVDPASAARLNPNDRSRLQRALEIFELTGRPMTELHQGELPGLPFELLEFAIMPADRQALHAAIAGRFVAMLDDGFVDEVAALRERDDLHVDLPAMKAVGYRQVWQYLDGAFDFETLTERGVAATRQLAKRQYTWLRSWDGLTVSDQPSTEPILKMLRTASILD